jgi:ribosome-associated protein
MLVVTPRVKIPLAEFEFTFARSGGPGGQNVNKVNSKATLRWPVTRSASLPEDVRQRLLAKHPRRITVEGDLLVVSQRFRDAGRNVADCLEKLRGLIEEAANPPKPRKSTKPTRGSVRRRITDKRQQGQKKQRRQLKTSED